MKLLKPLMDFATMNGHLWRRRDSHFDTLVVDSHDFHSNHIVDHDFFTQAPSQNKHDQILLENTKLMAPITAGVTGRIGDLA
jgi:hypothetical protein